MRKLLLTTVLVLISQMLISQMSCEFSTWLKNSDEPTKEYIVKYNFRTNHYQRVVSNDAWKVLAVASGATILEAIGDGLYDEGKANGNRNQMRAGKLLQAGSIGVRYFYIPIAKSSETHWLWIPAIEVGCRILWFDPTYNMTRGIPATQIGNTSYWDQALRWTKQPESMLFFGRTVVGFFTISITLNKF